MTQEMFSIIMKKGFIEYIDELIDKNLEANNMVEKVQVVGIKKEQGYLYFVDKDGDISRAKMARGARKKSTE